MQPKDIKSGQAVYLILLLVLVSLTFLPSQGTEDVDNLCEWTNRLDVLGIVPGFAAIEGDYPPYGLIVLTTAARACRLFGIGVFAAIKLSVILFLFLTSFIFWWWTRHFVTTIILYSAVLLNSVALGYIDLLFAPSLILSLKALKEEKLTLFSILYLIACLTKWQPLIIAPFAILYVLNISRLKQWKQIPFKTLTWKMIFPGSTILLLTLSVFGLPLLRSFQLALSHPFLSGNGLNSGWVLTHFLHLIRPQEFGGLINGEATCITRSPPAVTAVLRLLFALFYLTTAASFFRRDKTFEDLLNCSLVGYLAYFTFNTGVHENHLFLVTVLSVILFSINNDNLLLMIALIVMDNINLFLFYGVNGTGPGFRRALGGALDIALLQSMFNISFFLMLWIVTVMRRSAPPGRARAAAASVSLDQGEN